MNPVLLCALVLSLNGILLVQQLRVAMDGLDLDHSRHVVPIVHFVYSIAVFGDDQANAVDSLRLHVDPLPVHLQII